jgi:hypothetical protein
MASLIAAIVLAVAATVPGGAPLQVTVVAHGGAKEPAPAAGVLRVTPVGGAGMAEVAPISVPFRGPGSSDVTLPGALVWEVRAEAEGWWSAPVPVYVVGAPATVTLDLWPACELRGALTIPEGEKPPPSIAVHFATSNPAVVREGVAVVPDKDTPPFGDVACPVKERRVSCVIAAGVLDLKLKAAGFVPHYLWARKLPERGVLDVGTLALKPGASLAGSVTTASGPADPKTCELSLTPLEGETPPLTELGRTRARVAAARPNPRGFFTFDGLAPGLYTLEARQPGFAPGVRGPIRIEPRSETEIPDRIVLERPLTLSVEVRPPRDAQGNPWTVQVYALQAGRPTSLKDEFTQRTARDGTLDRKGIAPGPYGASLLDSDGNSFLWQDFELSASSSTVVLETHLVPLAGTVTLGGKPLTADLYFGGRDSRVPTPIHSDEAGAFSGVLSREGTWLVQVVATAPPVERRLHDVEVKVNPDLRKAEVELRLPDNRVTGTVVDEGGKPVSNAWVRVAERDARDFSTSRSGDGGRFELQGLANGRAAVRAQDSTQDGPRYSQEVKLELDEQRAAPDVRLVLERATDVVLTVTAESGEPVAGASILGLSDPTLAAALPLGMLTTDSSGTVRIHVPAEARRLEGVVLPPGYAFQAFDAAIEKGEPLSLAVTRFGGTLRLQLPFPFTSPGHVRADDLMMWADGVPLFPGALLQWAQVNGVAVDYRGTRFTIPHVAPGDYRLCVVSLVRVLEESSKDESQDASCADGFLPRLGELPLVLQPPS